MCKCPEYKLHWDVFLFSILEMISVFYLMKTGKKYVFFWWGIFRKVDEGSRHGIKTFSLLCIDTPCLILWKKFSKKKKKKWKNSWEQNVCYLLVLFPNCQKHSKNWKQQQHKTLIVCICYASSSAVLASYHVWKNSATAAVAPTVAVLKLQWGAS